MEKSGEKSMKMIKSRKLVKMVALMLATILLLPISAVTSMAAENYGFVVKWGSYGSADGQFYGPYAVTVDSNGNVYVADTQNHRIQKFTSDGTFITKWGSQGTADGQFQYPFAVAVDSSGNVYVADTQNHRIQKFTSDGTFITKWGSQGTSDDQFKEPWGVAVDSSGNVYVADRLNNRIQKFSSDGIFITKWGSQGTADGQFEEPFAVAVDSSGNVYVADTFNHRIQKFTSDGTFITKWGSKGLADGQFNYPYAVTVDSNGNVYVADTENCRIQKFSSDGTFITKWGTAGIAEYGREADGQFYYPTGVSVDSNGNVYVADNGNSRIQKFAAIATSRFPELNSIGNKTVDEGQPLVFTVSATDPDGDTVALTATGLPAGATFDSTPGEFKWTPGYTQSGNYSVHFEASDGSTTDSEDITITVNNISAEDLTGELLDDVGDLNLPSDVVSLKSKLNNIIDSIQRGDKKVDINKLNAFINEVEAQRGKKLTASQADELINKARLIIQVLGLQ